MRCSAFVATSLDGYIAREDGRIDWLEAANALMPPGEDCGYQAFLATIDAIVMGRGTYETVLGFPEWPFGELPVVILSSGLLSLPDHLPPTVSPSAEALGALLERLERQGLHRLYIDGGITIQRFLSAGLLDELTITVVPVLLGEGRPLFARLPGDLSLELEESRAFPFGFVQNRYRVLRSG